MDQDLDGQSADGVEGAEDVEGWRGTETKDGLPLVQDYESLKENHRHKNIQVTRADTHQLFFSRSEMFHFSTWNYVWDHFHAMFSIKREIK